MILILDTSTKTFRYTFALSLLVFSFILFAAASYSWTGPTGTAPANNVEAPINVGAASQVKSGALSVNGLSVYGSQYVQDYLGVGSSAASPWRVYAPGRTYGIYAEATTGQAIRGYVTGSGYAGFFDSLSGSSAGGLFARNGSGYYAYLGYPGSSWGVYTNGRTYASSYSRADGGFCIGGSCKTSWGSMGGSYWTTLTKLYDGGPKTHSCASGYVITSISLTTQPGAGHFFQALCTSLAP